MAFYKKKFDEYQIGDLLYVQQIKHKGTWLECNGSEISKEEYPELFEEIGPDWGISSSEDFFCLPDMGIKSTSSLNDTNIIKYYILAKK